MKKEIKNKIFCMDCLDGFKMIENNSIDLIITSPPYNLGNNHHTGRKKHKPYEDNMDELEYQKWQTKVLNECFRVLKNDGSMLYNHKNRIKNGLQITPYEWILKTNFVVKQEIVWVNRSQNFDNIRFYPFTERIYWLTKNNKTKLVNKIKHSDFFDSKEWKPRGIKDSHTRSFPEKMVNDLMLCFPNAKIIMDPFAGSGTTLVAAKKMNKNYIGFEIDKNYCELINKNLHE